MKYLRLSNSSKLSSLCIHNTKGHAARGLSCKHIVELILFTFKVCYAGLNKFSTFVE